VSNYHAYFDASEQMASASARIPSNAIASLRCSALEAVSHLVAEFKRRHTQRAMARFPAHLLADMGFERDWDGSVVSIVNGEERSR
jgi:hypothetical protein